MAESTCTITIEFSKEGKEIIDKLCRCAENITKCPVCGSKLIEMNVPGGDHIRAFVCSNNECKTYESAGAVETE